MSKMNFNNNYIRKKQSKRMIFLDYKLNMMLRV